MLLTLASVCLLAAPPIRIAVLPVQGGAPAAQLLAKDVAAAFESVGKSLPGVAVLAGPNLNKATKAPFLPKRVAACGEDGACLAKLCKPAKAQVLVWSNLTAQDSGALIVSVRRLSASDGALLEESSFEVAAMGDAATALRVNAQAIYGVAFPEVAGEEEPVVAAEPAAGDAAFDFELESGTPTPTPASPSPSDAPATHVAERAPNSPPTAPSAIASVAVPKQAERRGPEVPPTLSPGVGVAPPTVRTHPSLWPATVGVGAVSVVTALAGSYYGFRSRQLTNKISPAWQQVAVAQQIEKADAANARANAMFAVAVSAAATAGVLALIEWVWPAEQILKGSVSAAQ